MKALHSLLAAIVTFTRIPVPWTLDAAAFSRASLQLPLLGWLIGAVQLLLYEGLRLWIPADVALFFALLFPIVLSGGMHEDGLADFADGMLGGASIERRLEIMKDPRVGSFGVLALIVVLGGDFLFLSHTNPSQRGLVLLSTAVFSRSLCIPLLAVLPYKNHAGSRSQGFLPRDFHGWKTLLPLWPLLPAFYLLPWAGVVIVVLFFILQSYLRKNLEGLTGDCLGASIKFAECACFLLGCCLWPLGGRP